MNHRLSIVVFFTIFSISSINCVTTSVPDLIFQEIKYSIAGITPRTDLWNHGWSFGLEYQFGDTTKNPNGDLNITLGYQIHTNNHSSGLKNISCNIQYENKPGLLGSSGHLQGTFDGSHHNKIVDTFIKIATIEANTILDYNPEIIARNKRLIAQFKAQKKRDDKEKQEKLEKLHAKIEESNQANKDNFSRNRETFLEHKATFESLPFDENNPKHIRSKKILEELEKIYGS